MSVLMENFVKDSPEIPADDLKNAITGMPNHIFCTSEASNIKKFFCTHCHQEYILKYPARTYSTEELELYRAKHREYAVCAMCGHNSELINTGRLKRLSALNVYKNVAFVIPVNENEVYIRCEIIHKDFQNMNPRLYRESYEMYHFCKNKKPEYYRIKYSYLLGPGLIMPKTLREPFGMSSANQGFIYYDYVIIGAERLENTFFKYSLFQRPGYKAVNDSFKYLALFSEYPQKVELLLKGGFTELLDYKIKGLGIRHVVNWNAEKLKDFFKLSKSALNEWKEYSYDMDLIAVYTSLFKGEKNGVANAREWNFRFGKYSVDDAKRIIRNYGVSAKDIIKYFTTDTKRSFITWKDYIDAASDIGYDLTVHNVLFPKNLTLAHNEAVKARKLKTMEAEQRKARARYDSLMKKYGKENSEYFIRPPHDAGEIIDEGNALRHCVGGYAARHANGTTTILFMRSVSQPDKPLYTIEMDGKRLRQVHGYRNQASPSDIPSAKAFFDEWLSWVKAGSKKAKKRKKQDKRTAATA